MKNHTLSVKVEDKSGVLTRISGLFARRGFNIKSLAVGSTEKKGVSRITIIINGTWQTVDQVIKQLYKLVNVIEIQNLSIIPSVERELLLIKLKVKNTTRSEILEIVEIFRAKIVDFSRTSLIIELTGSSEKVRACEQILHQYEVLEIVRTGKIALARSSNNLIF